MVNIENSLNNIDLTKNINKFIQFFFKINIIEAIDKQFWNFLVIENTDNSLKIGCE
jgi:hypothetical protein